MLLYTASLMRESFPFAPILAKEALSIYNPKEVDVSHLHPAMTRRETKNKTAI